ncbi:MAG TPA: glycine--tRNA ligase subunit alpha [Terriglobia bacterium]|nr:glycine--tRNA ligase subunit alpha [Terriglobia bacterium]
MAVIHTRPRPVASPTGLSFQQMILRLNEFWAQQGCVLALTYDLEVGAGTMCPETFLRVLGPRPWRVAYVQPSRRPADGRYGENPHRLLKHTQLQVILKPPPTDIQEIYLASLEAVGIDLRHHDIRFEEDNWEAPTLGAWGIGWQVMLDGLEITQFTYFQQSGGLDLEPITVELTYGLERIAAFLQNVNNVFEIRWNNGLSYGDLRRVEEFELSVYDFELASRETSREIFERYEGEALRLLSEYPVAAVSAGGAERTHPESARSQAVAEQRHRFPLRKVYELCLKCSHLFNILDARGAISVTERVALIARVRRLACEVARIYVERLDATGHERPQPAVQEGQPA